MIGVTNISFFNDEASRRAFRTLSLGLYFVIFQLLIILQKPFLQFEFIFIFYSIFGVMFFHHFFLNTQSHFVKTKNLIFLSYLVDFFLLLLFMRFFPYLSSFVLVLQLFLLFISSFELDTLKISLLGFFLSVGTSVISLSNFQSGSLQSILSLTLFNLSYLAVMIISRQLRQDIDTLQFGLSQTWKKWRSQAEFSKSLVEKLPFGVAVFQSNEELVMQNSYLADHLNISTTQLKNMISMYKNRNHDLTSDLNIDQKTFNFDHATYFDEVVSEKLDLYLIKDVTELRKLEYQLKQKEKLAAVGTLAAGIAHEIRNPLAGISGSIQMLSEESTEPTQKKLMGIVLKEIDRLNILITEFLDYAKPEKAPDTEINLKKVIEEVVASLKMHPELPPNFQWDVQLKDCLILGINEKLKQAFLNIMINAIQAMKNSTQPRLSIKLEVESHQVVLTIEDTGVGMSEENRLKMFEPFHTTKPKGTGLGLAVTHKIIEQHRAEVEIKSQLNVGTEFKIKFPLSRELQ